MNTVFLLWHVRQDDPHSEDAKLIGVYSSADGAQAAIELLGGKPGFSEHPAGFQVDAYELDKHHWTEGFGLGVTA